LTFAGLANRQQSDVIAYLTEENRVLREQVGSTSLRLTDDQRRRLAAKAKKLSREALTRVASIVSPDTLMRWHRRLIAAKWTCPPKRRAGRPGLMREVKALILRMATDNPAWGYCRIQGELNALGHRVASSTVANVLRENGVQPTPYRRTSWRVFLNAHWNQLAATDFFTAEVWTAKGLTTHYVLYIIDLATWRVHLAGITTTPNEAFMLQVARNLTDVVDGFLRNHGFLICDRDTKFTAQFKRTLEAADVRTVLTPYRAPNANAYAERFVLSIKSECLNRMVLFGESSLRRAVTEYIEHYNVERPHQGLENEPLEPRAASHGCVFKKGASGFRVVTGPDGPGRRG